MRADRILDIKGTVPLWWVNFYGHIHATVPEYAAYVGGTFRMDMLTKILLEEYDAELIKPELCGRDDIYIEFPTEAAKTFFLLKFS